MTRDEALDLLGVQATTAPDELQRRYQELHNDFQIRLTNAPTPTLKKTYQKSLQDLRSAIELLAPGASGSVGSDLPSSEPVAAMPDEPQRLGQTRQRAQTSSNRKASPEDVDARGLSRGTTIAVVAAAVCAAAVAYLLIVQQGLRADVAREAGELALARESVSKLTAIYASLPYAEPLRVRNSSRQTAKITALALSYLDERAGEIKSVHSGNFDYPTWEIKPGAVVRIDAEVGRGSGWTGGVIFYGFLVEYPDVEPFLKAGVWSKDMDGVDKVLVLKLD